MSPTLDGLFRLFHVLSVGLFAGALLSIVVVQGLIAKAAANPERKVLAEVGARVARQIAGPFILAGWIIGVVYWITKYSTFGAGKLMACTPIFVHSMLLFGTLALGAAQAWKKKTRQVAESLAGGEWGAEGQKSLKVANITATAAMVFLLLSWAVAALKVPDKELTNCKGPDESAQLFQDNSSTFAYSDFSFRD